MATYYNLKTIEGLKIGDKVLYTTNISDVILSGYTVNIFLHGKSGKARPLNDGFSYCGAHGIGGRTDIYSLKVSKSSVGYSFTMNNGVCLYSGKTTTGVLMAVAGNGGSSGAASDDAFNDDRIEFTLRGAYLLQNSFL